MIAVLDIAPCCLAQVGRRFGGAYCPHHQGDITYRPDDGGYETT
jgi:hypothetical protein